MKHLPIFLLLILAMVCVGDAAMANPFLSGRPSDINSSFMSGFSMPYFQQIMGLQRQIHEAITGQIEQMKEGRSLSALWGLLLFSFGYGVFHVLAPGHGKVIVSSYFLGNRAKWRDGVWAGLLMAVGHTITAVGIVGVLYLVFGLAQFKVLSDAQYIELAGYGMIAAIGFWLLYRALTNKPECAVCGHGHAHTSSAHDHHHDHKHDHDRHHHHAGDKPAVLRNKQATSLFAAASLVPCTGSMIILLFTLANGVLWAGVLAVIAIALGMWVTITIIGLVSILLRRMVVGAADEAPTAFRRGLSKALRAGAALIVIATGGLLFVGTLYSMMG